MRVLIIADHATSSAERQRLARLEVGIADEGLRVIHAQPAGAAPAGASMFVRHAVYEEAGLWPGSRRRVDSLLKAVMEGEQGDIDVVHAFGSGAFALAMECAARSGAALAISVVSDQEAGALVHHAPHIPDLSRLVALPVDARFQATLHARIKDVECRVAPIGVHAPSQPRSILDPSLRAAIVLVGSGADARAWSSALSGVQQVVAGGTDTLVFADARPVARVNGWKTIDQLGLAERVSLVPDVEAQRDAVLDADVLVRLETTNAHSSFVLDAMAAGMVVVTAPEPTMAYLAHEQTCFVVSDPSASGWKRALEGVLTERDRARAVALRAHQYVRREHKASAEVSGILDAYEWLRTGRGES